MDSQLWMNFGMVQNDQELRPLPFSSWTGDFEMTAQENFFPPPLMQNCYSDPHFPSSQDLLFQDNFSYILDGDDAIWDDIIMDASMLTDKDLIITNHCNEENNKLIINKNDQIREREDRVLTFEEVSRYFSMPIIQAAKELNIGLTLLKKKCRELGIPRWPHRKMKSMQTLIKNVQELGWQQEGIAGELHVRTAIEILEQEKKLMEIKPSIEMQEKTKRLRQACFKANYKKRRLMSLHGKERPYISQHQKRRSVD